MQLSNVNKDVIRSLADKHGKDFNRLDLGTSALYEGNIDRAVELIKPEVVVRSIDDYYFVIGGNDVLYRAFGSALEHEFALLRLPVFVRNHRITISDGNYELCEVPFASISNIEAKDKLWDTTRRIFYSVFFVTFLLKEGSDKKRMLEVASVFTEEEKIKYIEEVFENDF